MAEVWPGRTNIDFCPLRGDDIRVGGGTRDAPPSLPPPPKLVHAMVQPGRRGYFIV